MKFISWNVNGFRAVITKGFTEYFNHSQADFFCIQESKLQEGNVVYETPGYHQFWNYAQKKGYSGTAIFTKHEPNSVRLGLPNAEHNTEGRVITLEYDTFFVVTVYTPNSQRGLARLEYRMEWDKAFKSYVMELDTIKPVIMCGDFNVAHQEIDLKNPKSNVKNAGFTPEERTTFSKLLDSGFTDTFRFLHPDQIGYSWWSYMFNARENNVGWRIDYWLVSQRLQDRITASYIEPQVMGSDHAPVVLDITI